MCVQVYMHDSECVNLTLVLMSSSIAIQKRHFRIAECKPMKPPSAWLARLSADSNHCAMQCHSPGFTTDAKFGTLSRNYIHVHHEILNLYW